MSLRDQEMSLSFFEGEIKRSQDALALLFSMKKLFRLHDYVENMKDRVATFSLKGKEDIWWEDVKNFRGIREEELN